MGKLVLVSHGQFCSELKKSVEMIMGPQEEIYAVGLRPSESPEEFQAEFEELTKDFARFTVFADLMGGTPCNVVARNLYNHKNRFDLYTGMNLPMVVSFVNTEMVHSDKPSFVEEAKSGISYLNDKL